MNVSNVVPVLKSTVHKQVVLFVNQDNILLILDSVNLVRLELFLLKVVLHLVNHVIVEQRQPVPTLVAKFVQLECTLPIKAFVRPVHLLPTLLILVLVVVTIVVLGQR